jgi:hypothetical protein
VKPVTARLGRTSVRLSFSQKVLGMKTADHPSVWIVITARCDHARVNAVLDALSGAIRRADHAQEAA